MKKLKSLNVIFSSDEDFLSDVKNSLSGKKSSSGKNSISFDSMETFKRVMSPNKLELLMAIARLKPESINQLAKSVSREFPHVYNDCYSLADLGFILLEEVKGARKQFRPCLSFDYDVIRVKAKIEEFFPITEKSNLILIKSMVG